MIAPVPAKTSPNVQMNSEKHFSFARREKYCGAIQRKTRKTQRAEEEPAPILGEYLG
jgi:hypothetical protein